MAITFLLQQATAKLMLIMKSGTTQRNGASQGCLEKAKTYHRMQNQRK